MDLKKLLVDSSGNGIGFGTGWAVVEGNETTKIIRVTAESCRKTGIFVIGKVELFLNFMFLLGINKYSFMPFFSLDKIIGLCNLGCAKITAG